MKGKFALIPLLMAMAGAADATVIYTYTGNHFDNFAYASGVSHYEGENFFTTDDFLTVQLTLSDLLPASSTLRFNQTLEPIFNSTIGPSPVTPLAWQMSAGPLSFSSSDWLSVSLSTDASGNIYSWDITMYEKLPSFPYGDGTDFAGVDSVLQTRSWSQYPGSSRDYAASCLGDQQCLSSHGYPVGSVGVWEPHVAGTWTVTEVASVPAPATALLFATGLMGLVVRRRKANG